MAAQGLYPPGYQADLEHVWGLVKELSDVLEENRATTAQIMAKVEHIHNSGGAVVEEKGPEGNEGIDKLKCMLIMWKTRT